MNTSDFLTIAVSICPDRDFVVFGPERLTYRQAQERINRLAGTLAASGLKKGDRIGMLSVNCPQVLEAYFAAAKTGAIFVPLNFRARAEELFYMLDLAQVRTLFVGERYLDMIRVLVPRLPSLETCISIEVPCQGMWTYEDLIRKGSAEAFPAESEDDRTTTILLFTSGTTGRPKAVPLTHRNLSAYIVENVDPADPDKEEKNLLCVPLYHVAGMQAMLAAVYAGRTLILMRQFDAREWLETAEREKINRAMLVPTMLKQIIDLPGLSGYDLSELRIITYGAAPMPLEVIQKAIQALPHVRFVNAFGQTETGSTIAVLSPEDHIVEGTEEEKEKKRIRLSCSIGRPLPDVEVRIVDEQGNRLPPKVTGEIVVRGERVMSGYWRNEDKTARAFTSDGWLRTSDMGWMDEEGYIYLAGRSDDLIIRGGENISPKEIEDVLETFPKIREAAVIGVPDPEWGQQPCAVVVLNEGETAGQEEIMEYCRNRLASFKRPRSVIFVNELPRDSMGKVSKQKLAKEHGAA